MQRALDLAINGCGAVSPNPMVGAVIVRENVVLAEGWHEQYGGPHAEVNAINRVEDKELLKESTVYVTLEPCSHHGKTPPCADLLVAQHVRKVVIGVRDSNPEVAGKGVQKLKDAGIEVVEGVLEAQCRDMNRRFFTSIEKGRPYIMLKWAQTADGFVARSDYSSKWISGAASRNLVHKWRAEEDAILIGPNTALYDDPSLTVREWHGRNPVRVVLDRKGRLPLDLRVFTDGIPTLYYSAVSDSGKRSCTYVELKGEHFIEEILADLHHRKIQSVMVEGGAVIHQLFLQANLWDEARVFISTATFGEGIKAAPIPSGRQERFAYHEDELLLIRNK